MAYRKRLISNKIDIHLKYRSLKRQKKVWIRVKNGQQYFKVLIQQGQGLIKMQEEKIHNETTTNMGKDSSIPETINRHKAVSSMLFIFITSLAAYLHYSRRDQPFKPYVDTSSYYPQQNPKIYAGQIHFARVPVQYWEHRILMVKAMGMNALSVYIMWNYHQIQRGKFDFQTQNKNLDLFLRLAEKHKMKVLIRPGPYVCAQWDFGGLPSRLLADSLLQIRSKNKRFMQQVKIYFTALAPILKEHLWTHENTQKCIIMLQIENEYGFFGTDIDYIMALRKMWRGLKVITAQYYVDWFINVRKSHWQGANIGLNDAFTQVQIDYIKTTLEPKGLVFGGQIYSGWLTFWHSPTYEQVDPYKKVKQYQFLMSHNLSYAMYMVHGGTSFGLTAGANSRYVEQLGFSGQLTSYDYDAPINEQGSATLKYHVFRDAIRKYASWEVPETIPDPIPMRKIPAFKPTPVMSLLDNINWDKPTIIGDKPYVYESQELKMFHLGIVIYEIKIPSGFSDTFTIQAHDLCFISIDNNFYQLLDRTLDKRPNVPLVCHSDKQCTVRFMVEAMGHVNYDLSMKQDFKGIIDIKSATGANHSFKWKMYPVLLNQTSMFNYTKLGQNLDNMPVLLRATIEVQEPADTYFNMKKYTKGYLWVNNYNLGRFWNVGPQQKLFCPGVWLKKGQNQIRVLDLRYTGDHQIRGELTLKQNQGQF